MTGLGWRSWDDDCDEKLAPFPSATSKDDTERTGRHTNDRWSGGRKREGSGVLPTPSSGSSSGADNGSITRRRAVRDGDRRGTGGDHGGGWWRHGRDGCSAASGGGTTTQNRQLAFSYEERHGGS